MEETKKFNVCLTLKNLTLEEKIGTINFRSWAEISIRRPFNIRYDPYTREIEIQDLISSAEQFARNIKGMFLISAEYFMEFFDLLDFFDL